jgi:ribosomal protein S18 acetylase RimI-like enzyme
MGLDTMPAASSSGDAKQHLDAEMRPLAECPSAASILPLVLSLVHEAGNPYFDWFFGDGDEAHAALARWMERPSSEVASERVTVVLAGGRPAGMFVGLGGAEVERCRKADLLAATREAAGRPEARAELLTRLEASRGLFAPVDAAQFYLSKMGVVRSMRGEGLGRVLTEAYVTAGRAQGFRSFRLDVSADNEVAVALYRSAGFEIGSAAERAGMTYLAMVRDES